MIRYLQGSDLAQYPVLASTMFEDRKQQFGDRLGWDVYIDENGHERDQYDRPDTIYCILELEDGTHGGSGRLLPTTRPTMVNEHFSYLSDGVRIVAPDVWESSRFCVSPRLTASAATATGVSTRLMLAGCRIGLAFDVNHYVAVFDAPMLRVYRATGWAPRVVDRSGKPRDRIRLGLWEVNREAYARIVGTLGSEGRYEMAESLAA